MADTEYSKLAEVEGADSYQEAAIILSGPPIEVFAQRAAPTVTFKQLKQSEGKFYYECKTASAGYMQLGWADEQFKANAVEGKGCGDDTHSWAYDGRRALKWHGNKNTKYGKSWSPGDVIGIAIDIENKKIMFTLNGDDLGAAFEDVTITEFVYPCVSLARGERAQIFLGYKSDPFHYQPPLGFHPLRMPAGDSSTTTTDYNKFCTFADVIKMGLAEKSFNVSGPGNIMVTIMGRGLDYEAKKNAMMHAGYEETVKKWEKIKTTLQDAENIVLSINEIYAVICYTLEKPPVYRYFNSDTRKGYGGDGMDFPIISYLLQEACRKILAATPKDNRTKVVYRGVSIPFAAEVGQVVRFGSYTSTTGNNSVAEEFRKTGGTQFVITTKIGAAIKSLSAYPEEDEVLLPPYEVYRVQRLEQSTIYLESLLDDDFVEKYIKDSSAVNEADAIATRHLK